MQNIESDKWKWRNECGKCDFIPVPEKFSWRLGESEILGLEYYAATEVQGEYR